MTSRLPIVLLATMNAGKRAEFAKLLPEDVQVLTLGDLGVDLPPEEGTTFAETAAMKARFAATQSGFLSIADDSGLEVDALGGAPGLYSARYAGEPRSDERNRKKLLHAMREVPARQRTARFRCAVAIALPTGLLALAEGTCEGMITTVAAGERGFGYDSIFLLPSGQTMAEISLEEKNKLSHRAKAYSEVLPVLLSVLRSEGDPPRPGSQ